MLDKDFEIRTERLVLRFLTESDYELWKSASYPGQGTGNEKRRAK